MLKCIEICGWGWIIVECGENDSGRRWNSAATANRFGFVIRQSLTTEEISLLRIYRAVGIQREIRTSSTAKNAIIKCDYT